MERKKPSLAEVFSPRGVAVVGISQVDATSFGRQAIASLKRAGFPAIYPVHPKYTEVLGIPCYPSIRAVPGIVDHVIVSIPSESALSVLDDCAAKGVRSVHFFTAGFSESGQAERADMEKEMLKKAEAGGFRVIGPNCVGLFLPKSRVFTTMGVPLEPGPIAFISQSGGHAETMPFHTASRGLRFSKVVSYGNALDIDEVELLDYLTHDEDTEIIAMYVEGVKDGRSFLGALKRAASRKPVVIYKGGTTDAGKRTAHGHTASLTSSVAVFDAACRQLGAIRVDDVDELGDVLVALRFIRRLPRGKGVVVVGTGGGPSVLASDEMEKAGLCVPRLSAETQAELKQFLPLAGAIFSNPVDATNLVVPEVIAKTMSVLGAVPDIDVLLYHLGFHPVSRWGTGKISTNKNFLQPAVEALCEARQTTGKPILLALCPASDLAGTTEFLAAQEAFVAAGFPVFHSLRQAARALARIIAWNRE